jgi:assimilatory nitrate reductase catalytic subunit
MNPGDMKRLGLAEGDLAQVTSRRGSVTVPVQASCAQRAGQVFLPMHWSGAHWSAGGANALIQGALDPDSRQPELKHAAVRIEKADLPWRLAVLRAGADGGLAARLRKLFVHFDHAACTVYGDDNPVCVFRVAAAKPPPQSVLDEIDALLGLDDPETVAIYRDARRGVDKRLLLADGKLLAVRLAGETAAADWLRDIMAGNGATEEVRRWMMAPLAAPPAGAARCTKVVCSCHGVTDVDIRQAAEAGGDLEAMQKKTRCGTNCGSCLPEAKRVMAEAVSCRAD